MDTRGRENLSVVKERQRVPVTWLEIASPLQECRLEIQPVRCGLHTPATGRAGYLPRTPPGNAVGVGVQGV